MKLIVELFDYVFYRIYRYYKGQGNAMADSFASTLLAVVQCATFLDVMILVNRFSNFTFPNKFFFVIPFLLLKGINWYRFEKNDNYKKIEEFWIARVDKESSTKGWLVVLYLVISVLIPIINGV